MPLLLCDDKTNSSPLMTIDDDDNDGRYYVNTSAEYYKGNRCKFSGPKVHQQAVAKNASSVSGHRNNNNNTERAQSCLSVSFATGFAATATTTTPSISSSCTSSSNTADSMGAVYCGLLLLSGVLLVLFLIYFAYGEKLNFAIRIILGALFALRNKRTLPPAVSSAEKEQWEEPSESLPLDDDNDDTKGNKIIWGFWHSGEETLPGFCQLALKSWRVHHPDWRIIILSDANYKTYVSPSDVPSTFASLKVQFRSDLIRLAVLRRYGGLYMDASYAVFRAFDDIWDQAAQHNDLYLTSLVTMKGNIRFPNNCLILAPNPQNPVLIEWQQRCLDYLENPCLTANAAARHSSFRRVAHHFTDPALGALQLVTAYFGVLWNLTDVLYYEPSLSAYVRDHVWILPTHRWTFDHVMIKNVTLEDKEILHGESFGEGLGDWLRRVPSAVRCMVSRETALVDRMLEYVIAMKTSGDFYPFFREPMDFHLKSPTTLGMLHRASVDTHVWPVRQADTVGARRVVPVVGRSGQ